MGQARIAIDAGVPDAGGTVGKTSRAAQGAGPENVAVVRLQNRSAYVAHNYAHRLSRAWQARGRRQA